MKDRQSFLWLLVVLVSLLLGQRMLGQTFSQTPDNNPPWMAVLVIGGGSLSLLFGRSLQAARSGNEGQPAEESPAGRDWLLPAAGISGLPEIELNWRSLTLLLAVLLAILVLWRIPQLGFEDSYLLVFLAWFLSLLLFLAAIADAPRPSGWGSWLRQKRWLLLAIGGLVLIAFVLRAWRVGTLPYTLAGDEASQGLEALRVLNGQLRNPFTTGWLGVPTLSFFYNSLSIGLLGPTVAALRLPWVLLGTITILTTFLLVRQLFNTRLALLAAFILAVYHFHIHFSRLGSNQIADPFFLSLALYFLYRALDKRKQLDWALAGVITGLAFYFYAGARLTPVIILVVLGYLFILSPRKFWQENRQGIFVFLVAFLIAAAPIIQYALRFPQDFNARMNEVGIIQSGWLEQEPANRGEPLWSILFDQFRRAALAFNYYPDRTVWYGLREPLLDPLFGAVFLMGLIYGTLQLLNRRVGPRLAPMVAWWWGGMILGGMLTESPPSSQRLITLAVPASFFIAYALWEVVKLAGQSFPRIPRAAILVVAALFFGFLSLTTYFADYTPQRIYGGQNAELATEIAPMLNEWKEDYRFHFVGPPWMYWGFATLPYLVADADAGDLLEPIDEATVGTLLPNHKGAVFIVIPPRAAELDILRRSFPQGQTTEVVSPVDGRIMVTLYRVPGA